jgi:hypothetical protein
MPPFTSCAFRMRQKAAAECRLQKFLEIYALGSRQLAAASANLLAESSEGSSLALLRLTFKMERDVFRYLCACL